MKPSFADLITRTRRKLYTKIPPRHLKADEEGGCGVTGFACSKPIGGRHIFEPSRQMHNRGNGKGGGIAAAGLIAGDLGVTEDVLNECYLMQIAMLDTKVQKEVEERFITSCMEVSAGYRIPTLDDYREVEGLEIRPPDVWRYFVRVRPDVLSEFAGKNAMEKMDSRKVEDEYIWQNTIRLNRAFYETQGEKRAFVLSQGRNMMILKIVGYAEMVAQYYRLEDIRAHVWIAHQRYPTTGRVWHPAGAHPFMGLDEALVHNGDFANYFSVTEYLRQKNIYPQFQTDTEVAVLMFDLLNRVYGYPLEYIIEALAPTSEMDFDQLPADRQEIYNQILNMHIHGSPDGPWFFIVARNDYYNDQFQLIGITDTAMLRPQVFAFHDGEVQVGLICSEKQAIDATLASLAGEDSRICPVADKYWNARGGSHTDGGAFIFTVKDDPDNPGQKRVACSDKFGSAVEIRKNQAAADISLAIYTPANSIRLGDFITESLNRTDSKGLYSFLKEQISISDFNTLRWCCRRIYEEVIGDDGKMKAAIDTLNMLNDLRYKTDKLKRSSILAIIRNTLIEIFQSISPIGSDNESSFRLITWETRRDLVEPGRRQTTLVFNTNGFPPEGDECDARLVVKAYEIGWKEFICYGYRGQRFSGCGLGPGTNGVEIDVYGSSGDYLASGIDGMTIKVHGNAQDQVGQILKSGKLVIYGDVGQTFMYGAKGGEVYVMGNAAGRPLINAVGRPKVVINGTALDYLAESFMAGDAMKGGGFVILNGIEFDNEGNVTPLATPYPGSNIFSLAAGGAIFVRDPHRLLVEEQLNGGAFGEITPEDWRIILPFLRENERLFNISIEDNLLNVDGEKKSPNEVYRKIFPLKMKELAKESITE
jgi:glutamate synthase domain-containing protein 1/glutamate synthase domain-containing protein 3